MAAHIRFRLIDTKSRLQRRRAWVATVLAVCLLALTGSVALGNSGEPGSPPPQSGPLLIKGAVTQEELDAMVQAARQAEVGPFTDPAAAELLPHDELNRAEAEELLTSVFPSALDEAAGVFDDLEVERFHSDHVAVVSSELEGGSPSLLTSLLPLRDEDGEGAKEQVDLGLEPAGGDLSPANPLVEVEIPSEIAEGVDLPESGLSISLAGNTDRTASTVSGGAAFYPNVAEDSDLIVLPTPTGLETLTQLRTASAPTTQTFNLDLPAGATLQATADGGAEITQGGEPIVAVRPPTAIDAEGQAIPVSMEVSGNSLSLHASPPADAAYPILVDPLYESYTWMNSNSNSGINTDWLAATNNSAYFKPGWLANIGGTLRFGLNLWSEYAAVTPPTQASWNYYVPRYFSDFESSGVRPTSFIRNMTLSQVYFILEDSAPYSNDPRMYASLWDEYKGFASIANRGGAEGPWNNVTIYLTNPAEVTDVKNGGTALVTYDSVSKRRQAFVGQATVELGDKDVPGWAKLLGSSSWTNEVASPLDYLVSDSGLGIHALQLTYPKATGGSGQTTTSNQCIGSASNPCPRKAETASRTLAYDPKLMAQGESVISVTATDPVGNLSAPRVGKVKVDHSKPELSISGNLTEQGSIGTKLLEYNLGYSATDGDDAAATAQTPLGVQGTGPGQLERPQGIAVDGSGNIWVADSTNHRLLKFDPAGTPLKQVGSFGSGSGQFNDPRGVAVSSSGSIWVADSGNKRLQQFDSNGVFIRSVTHPEFSSLWGVATAPGGVVWVVDRNARKALKIRESDGAYLGAAGAPAQLTHPLGIAADANGNVWIVDHTGNKVVGYDKDGKYLTQFGSLGTGNGQFTNPVGIAVTTSGNLLVTDRDNNRVQEFEIDGRYLRQFAVKGSASDQLTEPLGIAPAPGGLAYIADAGNHRISSWTHADRNPQSGAAKVEIKVDGSSVKTQAPGCSTKNCSIGGSWTLRADDYSAGQHTVEVIATDAVGLIASKVLNIEIHGDRTNPTIGLSGSMTQQASLGTTLPRYKLRVDATDPGPLAERKSGVASTTIKVDGVVVDSSSPGCPAEGCSIVREWTLNSDNYSVGSHTVEVKATDAAGRSTTKTLSINIARDTIAPEIETLGAIYSAPSGWLEQKLYGYTANVTDEAGYGVTSVQLKIDGTVVKDSSTSCPDGDCGQLFGYGQKIDMNAYDGGEHPAELIATDGAGNKRKRAWTINVDPSGNISVSEATDTMEAVELTAPEATELTPVDALVTEAIGEEGSNPQLILQEGQLVSDGTSTPSTVSLNPEGGFAVETVGLDQESILNEEKVEIAPTQIGSGASDPEITDGSAAVISNSAANVDTILRPAFDGLMSFQAIRDATAPDTYSWDVTLGAGETLQLLDEHHAAVVWDDGTQAMMITAQSAHGADGEAVPTSLSVGEGNVITLTVHHRTPGFVYPVVAGVGWQGGFQTQPALVEEPVEESWGFVENDILIVGPPEPVPASEASASSMGESRKKYLRVRCAEYAGYGLGVPRPNVGECGNPFTGDDGEGVLWQAGVRGVFFYTPSQQVRHNGAIACAKSLYPKRSTDMDWKMYDAYECHYGPKTSDQNGGTSASAGHYLRAQAHWLLGYRGICGDDCGGTANPWRWLDVPLELRLFPSGNIRKIEPVVE